MGRPGIFRRTFLGNGLMLFGFARTVWAQLTSPPVYSPLTLPVQVPLESVTMPWRPVPFTAEGVSSAAADSPGRRIVIKGVLYRKAPGDDASQLSAVCVTCPHELCPVDLVTDPVRLAKMNVPGASRPIFECGCHFSKFDAETDGAWISGVAYRGLFRFRLGRVVTGNVEIDGIEDEALSVL